MDDVGLSSSNRHTQYVSQLKESLTQYRAFYYDYDNPGDVRRTNIVRWVRDGTLSISNLQPGWDTEFKSHIANANMIRERYGSTAQALQYGMPILSMYRNPPSWSESPTLYVGENEVGIKTLRDVLQEHRRVQLVDKIRGTALRFEIDSDGSIKSFIKYLVSGESFVLATGEKLRG